MQLKCFLASSKGTALVAFLLVLATVTSKSSLTMKVQAAQRDVDSYHSYAQFVNTADAVEDYDFPDFSDQISGVECAIAYSDGKFDTSIPDSFSQQLENLDANSKLCDSTIKNLNDQYKEKVRQQNMINDLKRRGAAGRLRIPARGISVAIFNSDSQAVCDARDSACSIHLRGQHVIGDHSNQEFRALPRVQVGDTVYIDTVSGQQVYKVVDRFKGCNTGYDLIYRDSNQSAMNKYANSICLYTCDGPGGYNVHIVYAVRVS